MDAQEIQFPALTPTSDDDGSTSVAVFESLENWDPQSNDDGSTSVAVLESPEILDPQVAMTAPQVSPCWSHLKYWIRK